MLIKHSTVTRIELTEVKNLDPIRVYIEDYEPGKGRITISCYTRAWVGYWGAMGATNIAGFFLQCDPQYLAGNMLCGVGLSHAKHNEKYLVRIIEAVQAALREASHVA